LKGGNKYERCNESHKENAMMKVLVSKLHIQCLELEYRLDKLQYSYVENSMGSYSAEELLLTWIDLDTNQKKHYKKKGLSTFQQNFTAFYRSR
jgi:hypothetical protein